MKKKQLGRLFSRHGNNTHRHPEFSSGSMWMLVRRTMSARTVPSIARDEAKPNNQVQHDVKRWWCFGRSMIEMLAVLAIIGVLSIGGVWGYRKAVTKHLANNVIDDIYLSGFLIMDELFNRLPDDDVGMDLTGKFDQKSPYTFKAFAETSSTFEILVQNVPYDVCQEVTEREIKDIDEIRANGFDKECFSDRTNEVSFFFDMNQSDRCSQDSDCGGCSKCVNNRCQYKFSNIWNGCFDCDATNRYYGVTKEECSRCKNRIYLTYETAGRCFSCNDSAADLYGVTKEECNHCKNRMWGTSSGSFVEGRCVTPKHSWWGVPKDECEKFPKHYSLIDGNLCLYCVGNFNPSTGICDTADCSHSEGTQHIFGVDETTCMQQCGGVYFRMRTEGGTKVTQCTLF